MIPSTGRTAAFWKFLISYSSALGKSTDKNQGHVHRHSGPSARRKQIHILYLLNDILHHTKSHSSLQSAGPTFLESFQQASGEIIALASSYSQETFPKHHRKIQGLVDLWHERNDLSPSQCEKLKKIAFHAAEKTSSEEEQRTVHANGALEGQDKDSKSSRDAPFIMPASHGDVSTPFYDLPAGNMMPLIIPNSTAPMNPQSMKPLQFVPGSVNSILIDAVQELLSSAENLDNLRLKELEDGEKDLDELGQIVPKDEIGGDFLENEAYYGWSRAFCRNMRKAAPGTQGWNGDEGRAESPSRSRSPRKRRRYSYSRSDRSRSRDLSRSRSRSSSVVQRPTVGGSQDTARAPDPLQQPLRTRFDHNGQNAMLRPPVPPPPPPFTQGFPLGPGGVPIPPRPPNYNGPWPPPPPPASLLPPGQVNTPPFPFSNAGMTALPPHAFSQPSVSDLYNQGQPFSHEHRPWQSSEQRK